LELLLRYLSLNAIAVTLVACGAGVEPPSDALTVSIDSSGPVPLITVSGEPPEWTLDSLAVIRPEAGVGFSNIRSIALDPRGGVWVADVGENRLSHWGDDGAWIEDRGRVGSGPGEFRTPYSVAVHAGALQVLDIENSRIVRFDLDGGADTSWLIPARVTGSATDVRLFPDPLGPRYMNFLRDPTPRVAFVRTTDSSDVVFQPENPPSGPDNVKVCHTPDGAIRFFASPFAPGTVRTPLGNLTLATSDGEYVITTFDQAAQPIRAFRRPAPRDSVSDAEFAAENADWVKFSSEHPGVACTGEIIRYDFKPSIRRLLPADDGALWVEQRLPGGVLRFEVWAGDSLIGSLSAPERLEEFPPSILGDRLALVAESPDGGHEVRLYRIRR
jgi:hypothetical protein